MIQYIQRCERWGRDVPTVLKLVEVGQANPNPIASFHADLQIGRALKRIQIEVLSLTPCRPGKGFFLLATLLAPSVSMRWCWHRSISLRSGTPTLQEEPPTRRGKARPPAAAVGLAPNISCRSGGSALQDVDAGELSARRDKARSPAVAVDLAPVISCRSGGSALQDVDAGELSARRGKARSPAVAVDLAPNISCSS